MLQGMRLECYEKTLHACRGVNGACVGQTAPRHLPARCMCWTCLSWRAPLGSPHAARMTLWWTRWRAWWSPTRDSWASRRAANQRKAPSGCIPTSTPHTCRAIGRAPGMSQAPSCSMAPNLDPSSQFTDHKPESGIWRGICWTKFCTDAERSGLSLA